MPGLGEKSTAPETVSIADKHGHAVRQGWLREKKDHSRHQWQAGSSCFAAVLGGGEPTSIARWVRRKRPRSALIQHAVGTRCAGTRSLPSAPRVVDWRGIARAGPPLWFNAGAGPLPKQCLKGRWRNTRRATWLSAPAPVPQSAFSKKQPKSSRENKPKRHRRVTRFALGGRKRWNCSTNLAEKCSTLGAGPA